MPKLLDKEANYTFRSYFELPNDIDEILAEFGYASLNGGCLCPGVRSL